MADEFASFHMIDVSAKTATARRALASGKITMSRLAFDRIRAKDTPKGDVLAQAEVAGILAAKRTSEVLPLCHPLPLDQVKVWFEFDESGSEDSAPWIRVICEARATSRTGVEMEALTGATTALLAVYDLTKAMDAALWISDVHLEIKEGGKSGMWQHPRAEGKYDTGVATKVIFRGTQAAVLTVSDRVSTGKASDVSGPAAVEWLEQHGAKVVTTKTVSDERDVIARTLRELAELDGVSLVISTGGTGLGPRDVTPEAFADVSNRIIPGIGEVLRADGLRHTPTAGLSRSLGGLIGSTLVVALPGSPHAVTEGLEALVSTLPHALHIARGGDHSKAQS